MCGCGKLTGTGQGPLGKKRRRRGDRENSEDRRGKEGKEGRGDTRPSAGSVVHEIACRVNVSYPTNEELMDVEIASVSGSYR
jgi:hypothetical protein